MITARSLSKSFGRKPVLRDLSFCARAGEITLLIGPNGAGKTTTMRLLTGLAQPDGGTAAIAGRDIVRERIAAQQLLSYLPQNPSFHPRFTCGQIVEFYAQLRGVDRARAEVVFKLAGVAGVAHEQTRTLSGGMGQRLGLALLLLPDAPVLLLDEPGISLDPSWRRRLQIILHDEAHRAKTVLVSRQLIAEWNGVAHRALLCRRGGIERELDPANLPVDFEQLDCYGSAAVAQAAETAPIK